MLIGFGGFLEKIIITAAITGAIHTPTMSPYLPITPEQIAEEAVKAAKAGAAVVHIHVRDPKNGRPTTDVNIFREAASRIREKSDVIVCLTTGGGLGIPKEDRIRVVPVLKPEMASLNMGSINFALYPLLKQFKSFKYSWEKEYLLMTKDLIFRNTFEDIEYFCRTMEENNTKPELECYDVGHLFNAAQLVRDGVLKLPLYIQFVMGILGGVGADIEQLVHMKRTADRLFGEKNYYWSVVGAGRQEFPLCITAAAMGSHGVRVGLEDNLYLRRGQLAKSNAELVEKIVKLVYEVTGREPATPEEVRKLLGLKGKDKVNF